MDYHASTKRQKRHFVSDAEAELQVLLVDRLGQPFETEVRPTAFQIHQEL
jgi:hypothetical protein